MARRGEGWRQHSHEEDDDVEGRQRGWAMRVDGFDGGPHGQAMAAQSV
jgi:hypothetical protein